MQQNIVLLFLSHIMATNIKKKAKEEVKGIREYLNEQKSFELIIKYHHLSLEK